MARCKLFQDWTWDRELPKPFNDPSVERKTTDFTHLSRYNLVSTKTATLHAAMLRAILAYMELDAAAGTGAAAAGAIGTQGPEIVIAEYPSHSGEIHAVSFNQKNGKFTAGCFEKAGDTPSVYTLNRTSQSGAALFFALLPFAMANEEFAQCYQELLKQKNAGWPSLDQAVKQAHILCDNFYRRIESANTLDDDIAIKLQLPTPNITRFTALNLEKGAYNPTDVVLGEFQILKVGASRKLVTIAHGDFEKKYAFSPRSFSVLERKLIPSLPDYYSIPEDVVELCEHAMKTTGSKNPMRNFMLRGPSGTGKSEGSSAFAAGIERPYVFQTCAADYEFSNLIGSYVPDLQTNACALADEDLPSFDDIRFDPGTAYSKLTGEYAEGATEQEVYAKLLEVIADRTATQYKDEGGVQYKYTETPFVQAIRNGWTVELQEPSIIVNQGVLVGLNGILDNCKTILLPTGEVLHRHPDAVVIISTNTNYVGCRPLNQSVISRMDLIIDMDEPSTEEMVRRVSGITGNTDMSLLMQMAQVIRSIQQKCLDERITDGSCGMREFIRWVQSYDITHNAMRAARHTILASVSQNAECRDDISKDCIEPVFG